MRCKRKSPITLDSLSASNINVSCGGTVKIQDCLPNNIPQESRSAYKEQRQLLNEYKYNKNPQEKQFVSLRKRTITQMDQRTNYQGSSIGRWSQKPVALRSIKYRCKLNEKHLSSEEVIQNQKQRILSTESVSGDRSQNQFGSENRVKNHLTGRELQNEKTNKVYNEILNGMLPSKIFTNIVEVKSDIERIERQRLFLKLQDKYQLPQMSCRRMYTENAILTQDQLGIMARDFSIKVQREHQYLLGQNLLRRKIEARRKERKEQEIKAEIERGKDQQKVERRRRAEQNIMLINQRKRIVKLVRLRSNYFKNQQQFMLQFKKE